VRSTTQRGQELEGVSPGGSLDDLDGHPQGGRRGGTDRQRAAL